MAFGRDTNKKKVDLEEMGEMADEIEDEDECISILFIGESGTGKTVIAVGGKFNKLDINGDKVPVNIKGFPLPMAVLNLEMGVKIKKLDPQVRKEIKIFKETAIDEIIAILEGIRDINDEMYDNTGEVAYKTIVIDGLHNIWEKIKGNMCNVKAKQSNTTIVKALGSGKGTSLNKITPEGTEYVPASSLWNQIKQLIIDIKRHAYVVVTVGRERSEWGKSITYKVSGHQNDEGIFDVWGICEATETHIQNKGDHKKYFFIAKRVRDGISGIRIEDFCFDKLDELY
jgi:hypothetical protein